MNRELKCNQVEVMIPQFIGNDLEYNSLVLFLQHLDCCESCKEELTIHYLITEGIARLEEGEDFDLNHDLQVFIEDSKTKVAHHKFVKCIRMTMEVLGILAILLVVLFLYL